MVAKDGSKAKWLPSSAVPTDMVAECQAKRATNAANIVYAANIAAASGNAAAEAAWYDGWRRCKDNSRHFGRLELITWDGTSENGNGEPLGFAGVLASESAEMRNRFVGKCKGEESSFVNEWENGFRWTCCGVDIGTGRHGCGDHHGDSRAEHACGCDFCRAGHPLSDELWRVKLRGQPANGLEESLRRGPDARSLSQAGLLNWQMRETFF